MQKILQFRSKKVLRAAITVLLLLTCFLPVLSASASTGDVIGVDGRIIPVNKTGDTSAWVEIAKQGNYSLIIRQTPLTSVTSMFRTDNKLDNSYSTSQVRKEINAWYNTKLSSTARLRNFAIKNTAISNLGTTGISIVDGISKPSGVAAPSGDDVAFALSFCEATYFCSTQHINQWVYSSILSSPILAYNNYLKLLPKFNGGVNPTAAFWLRSPGTTNQYAGSVSYQSGAIVAPYTYEQASGRVSQSTVIDASGHYRPALWVSSGLFDDLSITYDPNGGKGSIVTIPVSQNSYYVIQNQNFQPASATLVFDSWNTMANGTGVRYSNGQSVYITASIKLYAQWKAIPQLTVTYNPNGGLGLVKTVSVQTNSNYTITDQGYTKNGYAFDSWNTRSDGLGTRYTNNQVIYLTTSITLYAQWKVIQQLTVTYNPNGGLGLVKAVPVQANSNYIITDQGYTKNGYAFDSWNTRSDGLGTRYTNNQVIYLTTSITLYAQWKVIQQLTVTYNPNGGSGSIKTVYAQANSNCVVTDQGYTKNGYTFDSWNTRADGLGTRITNGQVIYLTTSLTLYAQWKQITTQPIYIIYDPNGGAGYINIVPVTANTNYIVQDQGYRHPNTLYAFDGWNTAYDGSGINYSIGQIIKVTTTTILYAKWKIVTPQTYVYVIYDPNGGIGYLNLTSVPVNTYYTLVDRGFQPINSAYVFDSWNTMPDGKGIKYATGARIYVNNHVVLYAQWRPRIN